MEASSSTNKRLAIQFAIIAGVIALILCTAVFVRHISGPRIVARAITPDGVEMRVIQRCNWNAEPFTTGFYFRKPGGQWGWFYFDHQDWYWSRAPVRIDTNAGKAVFFRKGSPAITFAWSNEAYTLHRWNRTLTGAQSRLPSGSWPEDTGP